MLGNRRGSLQQRHVRQVFEAFRAFKLAPVLLLLGALSLGRPACCCFHVRCRILHWILQRPFLLFYPQLLARFENLLPLCRHTLCRHHCTGFRLRDPHLLQRRSSAQGDRYGPISAVCQGPTSSVSGANGPSHCDCVSVVLGPLWTSPQQVAEQHSNLGRRPIAGDCIIGSLERLDAERLQKLVVSINVFEALDFDGSKCWLRVIIRPRHCA